MLFCDLDDFKSVNDGFGYGVGDVLLMSVVGWFLDVVGGDGLLVWFGGDEFVVLFWLGVDDVLVAVCAFVDWVVFVV